MFYADPKSRWALIQWPGIFWQFHSDRILATAWGTTTFWSVMSYFWSSIHFRSINLFQSLIIQKTLSYTHLFQKIIIIRSIQISTRLLEISERMLQRDVGVMVRQCKFQTNLLNCSSSPGPMNWKYCPVMIPWNGGEMLPANKYLTHMSTKTTHTKSACTKTNHASRLHNACS